MKRLNIHFLMMTASAAAGLWACGGGGGGGGSDQTDASGTSVGDAGGGTGGSGGGGPVGGSTGGEGGTAGGGGGSGGTGGAAGNGGSAGSGGALGGTPADAAVVGGTADTGLPPDAAVDGGVADAAPADPDGSSGVVCQSCAADEDCGGGTCLDVQGERYCSIRCAADEDCGADRRCGEVAGQDDRFCLPVDTCVPPADCVDVDGDGYGVGAACLGPDCDDGAPGVHPDVADPCDGVNNDCDDLTDEDFAPVGCGVGVCASVSTCLGGVEAPCVEGAPTGDDSVCNGADDDCDGLVDEAFQPSSCGLGVCAAESECVDGHETVCVPGAPALADDTTCNGLDEDCNGQEDEDYVGQPCGEGACEVTGVCRNGAPVCEPNLPLSQDDATCNGIDDNCDGVTDEDFTTDVVCGLGVCQRGAVCAPEQGGEICTPAAPLVALDETCDGLDDDCDGPIDEECGDNNFSLRATPGAGGVIDVAVVYRQSASPLADAADTQPRVLSLWLQVSPNLLIVPDNPDTDDDERATTGEALVAAEKGLTVIERDNNVIRLAALSAVNTNRIAPNPDSGEGVIAILHFTQAGAGPHSISWIENNPDLGVIGTSVAPPEAMAILSLTDVAIGP